MQPIQKSIQTTSSEFSAQGLIKNLPGSSTDPIVIDDQTEAKSTQVVLRLTYQVPQGPILNPGIQKKPILTKKGRICLNLAKNPDFVGQVNCKVCIQAILKAQCQNIDIQSQEFKDELREAHIEKNLMEINLVKDNELGADESGQKKVSEDAYREKGSGWVNDHIVRSDP